MMNLMSWLNRLVHTRTMKWEAEARLERERDPLSHPALQRMSLEQLADLPLERGEPPDQHAGGRCSKSG